MREKLFITPLHQSSKRNYIERVTCYDKGDCAIIAKQYGKDYWDGERQYGYGGYRYDGRWRKVAEAMAAEYNLKAGDKILDIGCGKGFLLYEFTQVVPGIEVHGLDISQYAIDNAKEEIKSSLKKGHAKELPYKDHMFDLVITNTTFHNLKINELQSAMKEVVRVMKEKAWICVESYRNEHEKANLLYWQLTCESFYSPDEWKWIYQQAGYKGDIEFIYFS